MTRHPLTMVVQHLRRLVGPAQTDLTDARLLERFAAAKDEAAFAALVERHAPMVWGVCRRTLHHEQDAEDAFQATFLVLARKAGSVRKSLGGWLYEVAYNVALKARASAVHRRALDERAPIKSPSLPPDVVSLRELRGVLDEELRRLPTTYRLALVLCYLEGKTNEEAARELGWPVGSMSKRLARGRELLRARLTQRGITLAAAGVAPLLTAEAASAGVSAVLLAATVKAALAFAALTTALVRTEASVLAEGVLQTLFVNRLKIVVGFVLVVGILGIVSGVVWYRAANEEKQPMTADNKESDVKAEDIREPARLHKLEIEYTGLLAFAPDGKTLVCAAHATVHVWDVATGVEITNWDKKDKWGTIALSANGKSVAMLEGRDRTHIVDAASGNENCLLEGKPDLYSVPAVLSPDGKQFAAMLSGDWVGGPGNFRLRLRFWDTATGKEQKPLIGSDQGSLYSMAFSPDGKVLALGFSGKLLPQGVKGTEVELYDVANRRLLRSLIEPRLNDPDAGKPKLGRASRMIATLSAAFSPDGKTVAAGNNDGGIDLWEVRSGNKVLHLGNVPQSLYEAALSVGAMQFTANGKVLVSAEGLWRIPGRYNEGKLHFWNLTTGKEIPTAGLPSAAYFALSPDGRKLAVSYRAGEKWTVEVWDVAKWTR